MNWQKSADSLPLADSAPGALSPEEIAATGAELAWLAKTKAECLARQDALRAMASAAGERLARQPAIAEFLEEFQNLAHQKAVGAYEELLGALVGDVLPGTRSVKLELTTERGLPGLDISICKDGKLESAMDGSGGAVTNLLSAGLRIIALSRSAQMPFLVLDEPDCWISPARVPRFASVLAQIARLAGMQLVIISHHDPAHFDGLSKVLRLHKKNGKIESETISMQCGAAPDGDLRLVSLRICDMMSHADTLIEFSPEVTCLTGANDLGKSAVAAAMKALFYGEMKDSWVSHGKNSSKIEARFSDGHRLVFDFRLSKSPKRRWRLYAPGIAEPLFDTGSKKDAPEWIADFCKIKKDDDLDLHFAHQKTPVFLLDQSPSKKAQILSIGKENSHLQNMVALNSKNASDDKKLLERVHEESETLRRKLILLEKLDALQNDWKSLMAQSEAIVSGSAFIERALAQELRLLALAPACLSPEPALPLAPALKPAEHALRKADAADALSRLLSRPALAPAPAAPELSRAAEWIAKARKSRGLAVLDPAASFSPPPPPPALRPAASWISLARKRQILDSLGNFAAPESPRRPELKRVPAPAAGWNLLGANLPHSLPPPPPEPPKLRSAAAGLAIGKRMSQTVKAGQSLRARLEQNRQREEQLAQDCSALRARLEEAWNGKCPACRSAIGASDIELVASYLRARKDCPHDGQH